MMYITAYPLTQRINPMRKLLLTTAAVAGEPSFGTFTDTVASPTVHDLYLFYIHRFVY